jgi:hypothetical protein
MTAPYNLTTADVAARYGLDVWKVRRLVRLGQIKAIDTGTGKRPTYRFSEDGLRDYETRRAVA